MKREAQYPALAQFIGKTWASLTHSYPQPRFRCQAAFLNLWAEIEHLALHLLLAPGTISRLKGLCLKLWVVGEFEAVLSYLVCGLKCMALSGAKWRLSAIFLTLLLALLFVSAERRGLKDENGRSGLDGSRGPFTNYFLKAANFLWQSDQTGHQHVWPVIFRFNKWPGSSYAV